MNYKKTWFGWLNFAVGTLFMSVYVFTLLVSLFEFNGLTMYFFDLAWLKASFVASIASILVVAGILIIVHFIKHKVALKEGFFNKKFFGAVYVIGVIVLLCAGLYFRYQAYLSFDETPALSQAYYLKVLSFFEGNTSGVNDILVLSFCYFYSFLFKVFGIDTGVLIVTNFVFQILGSVCVSNALRNSYGKTVSLGALSLLMLLPASVNQGLIISPDSLIFFIIAFIIYMFSLLLSDRNQGLMCSNSNFLLFVIFAIVFGLLIFINPVTLVVPFFFVIRMLLLEGNAKQEDIAVNRKLGPTLVVSIISIGSAAAGIAIDAYNRNVSLARAFEDYSGKLGLSGFFRIFYPDEYIIVCLVILGICFCGYINFVFAKKDFISALNVLFLLMFFVYAKNIISFDTSLYLIALIGALAGLGVKSVLFDDYGVASCEELPVTDEILQDNGEADNLSCVEAINDESCEDGETTSDESMELDEIVEEENLVNSEVIIESEAVEGLENINSDVSEINDDLVFINSSNEELNNSEEDFVDNSSENSIANSVVEDDIPFVPIENILPIPKKHIKKELGYAFEPDEKYMKYDYEISDNDDFDIP